MDATNDRILRDLREQLSWDSRVDASAVEASVEYGRVTLSGTVLTLSAKRAVEEDARIIDGVDDVVNALEVRPPAAGIEDRELAEVLRSVLGSNADLAAGPAAGASARDSSGVDIRVAVRSGLATLDGTVGVIWKKNLAEELLSSVRGVVGINNRLVVVPGGDALDERIAEEIARAVERSSSLHADMLDIRVEKGFVTLTGSVNGWHARHDAYRICLSTYGVVGVDEDLVVR